MTFLETEALLALMDKDHKQYFEILKQMTSREKIELRDAAVYITQSISKRGDVNGERWI